MPNAIFVPGALGDLDKKHLIVVDGHGGADFTDPKAACDYAATQSPTQAEPWAVFLMPGWYDVDPFTVPGWVSLGGPHPIDGTSWNVAPVTLHLSHLSGNGIVLNNNALLCNSHVQWENTATLTGDANVILAHGGAFAYASLVAAKVVSTGTAIVTGGHQFVGIQADLAMVRVRCVGTEIYGGFAELYATGPFNVWDLYPHGSATYGIYIAAGGYAGIRFVRFTGNRGGGGKDVYVEAGGIFQYLFTTFEDGITNLGTVTQQDAPNVSWPGTVLKTAALADLAGGISNPPSQAEVTAIYNKVNDLLARARTSGWLTP